MCCVSFVRFVSIREIFGILFVPTGDIVVVVSYVMISWWFCPEDISLLSLRAYSFIVC